MQHIFLIEDDVKLASLIQTFLLKHGYTIDVFNTAEAYRSSEITFMPSVIICDVMLPDGNGFELCKHIRSFSNIPIIFLTARNDEIDRVVGLEIGADDYITKPFSVKELISRVKAVMRRSQFSPPTNASQKTNFADNDKIIVGDIEMSPLRYEAKVKGELIDLRPREFELLYFLCDNAGNLVSREELFDQVWGYSFAGNSKTLDVHIQRIRERIEENPKKPKKLMTIRGMGYKLIDE